MPKLPERHAVAEPVRLDCCLPLDVARTALCAPIESILPNHCVARDNRSVGAPIGERSHSLCRQRLGLENERIGLYEPRPQPRRWEAVQLWRHAWVDVLGAVHRRLRWPGGERALCSVIRPSSPPTPHPFELRELCECAASTYVAALSLATTQRRLRWRKRRSLVPVPRPNCRPLLNSGLGCSGVIGAQSTIRVLESIEKSYQLPRSSSVRLWCAWVAWPRLDISPRSASTPIVIQA